MIYPREELYGEINKLEINFVVGLAFIIFACYNVKQRQG